MVDWRPLAGAVGAFLVVVVASLAGSPASVFAAVASVVTLYRPEYPAPGWGMSMVVLFLVGVLFLGESVVAVGVVGFLRGYAGGQA